VKRGCGRRDFLRILAASSTGVVTLPALAWAQTPPVAIASTMLSNGLWLFTGAGCNVLAASEPDGLVVVDGGLAGNSPALLAAIARETGIQRVRLLVNTHWHADHTGSNEPLGQRGATIVAHQNTRRWLSSRVYREQQDRVYPPRPAEALPTQTVARRETLVAGATLIDVGPLPPAHTNGDLYVFLPEANVLMVGDVLTVGRYPVMDYSTGGWIGGLIDACTALLGIADERTRIIPGLGAIQFKADLRAETEMLTAVNERVWTMIRQGKGLQEIASERPTREFDAKWGPNEAFLQSTYVGLVRHTHELGRVL
jgi:glyoxylase-like metal-dependent hydrolase (beta-lactamase superfamily II)